MHIKINALSPHNATALGIAPSALHACHTAAPEASYLRGQLLNSLYSTGKRKRN